MKNHLLFALAFVLCACSKTNSLSIFITDNAVADTVPETALPIHTPILYNINSNCAGYYETLPALYKQTTKKYPLIVFIHGIGELGTGLSRLNCCGLPYHAKGGTFPAKFLVNGLYYSFIVVSPQFKVRPSASQVQSVIDYAKAKYRVDTARVYVTGLSMGGGSTWDWSVVYGQKATAIVPVCAGTKPTQSMAASVASKNIPIWSLNSDADALVPIQWGKDWINWIDAANPANAPYTKLTIWSGLSHNATWGKAFNPLTKVDGMNIYEWMLTYSKAKPIDPTAPVANAGIDRSIPVDWNYMPTLFGTTSYDPNGWIASFKWSQVSGAACTIASPNAGQTKVAGLVTGTYVFRVTVTDNSGKVSYDDVKVVMTN